MNVEIIKDTNVKDTTLDWVRYLAESKMVDIFGREIEEEHLRLIKIVDNSYKENTPYNFEWQGMYKEEEGLILIKEHKNKDILELTLYHELFHVRFMSKNNKDEFVGKYECFYNFYNELYANIKSVEYMIRIVPFKADFILEYLKSKYKMMNYIMMKSGDGLSEFIDDINGFTEENEQITDCEKRESNEELIKNAILKWSQNALTNVVYITACLLAIEYFSNDDNINIRYIRENVDLEKITLENCEYIKDNLFKGLV